MGGFTKKCIFAFYNYGIINNLYFMNTKYRLSQEERGLGVSGITLEGCLEVYKGDELVATFDQYWFFHNLDADISDRYLCWNQDGTKVGFYGLHYPDGTLPHFDTSLPEDEIECCSVVCYLDLETKEVKEHPLKNEPLMMTWDNDDTTFIVLPDPVDIDPSNPLVEIPQDGPSKSPIEQLKKAAQLEFAIAREHIKTATSSDYGPYSFRKRLLEYYLFYYDPRYVKESAFKYCVKRRNDYLHSKGMPVPYGEDILDDEPSRFIVLDNQMQKK